MKLFDLRVNSTSKFSIISCHNLSPDFWTVDPLQDSPEPVVREMAQIWLFTRSVERQDLISSVFELVPLTQGILKEKSRFEIILKFWKGIKTVHMELFFLLGHHRLICILAIEKAVYFVIGNPVLILSTVKFIEFLLLDGQFIFKFENLWLGCIFLLLECINILVHLFLENFHVLDSLSLIVWVRRHPIHNRVERAHWIGWQFIWKTVILRLRKINLHLFVFIFF